MASEISEKRSRRTLTRYLVRGLLAMLRLSPNLVDRESRLVGGRDGGADGRSDETALAMKFGQS